MHRFGAAARTQPGLREVHTLKDRRSDASIGLAVWDDAAALEAARPALAAATEHDDLEAWEAAPTEGFLLNEV